MEELTSIVALLQDRCGMKSELLRPGDLERVVRQRSAVRGLEARTYYDCLTREADEFQELIEELVVPESWFFRDVQPFECLRWFASERRPLRLLSVPCGSGEEPLSMAMVLLAQGWQAHEIQIDAVDLSARAIERGRHGIYRPASLRENDASFEECRRFFIPLGESFRVTDEARSVVRFRQGNLLEPGFLALESGRFDVIFCRNLLIYFTDEARARVMDTMARLLSPGGMLYLGHTEGRLGADPRFVPLTPLFPFAFTCRSADTATRMVPDRVARSAGPVPTGAFRREMPIGSQAMNDTISNTTSLRPMPPRVAVVSKDYIAEARIAADQGRLEEASCICEKLLRQQPSAAPVQYLLGVVRQAQGRDNEARSCFERTLYLDPGHQEALIHLALLADQRGDTRQAAQYRRRAERAGEGQP